MLSPTTTIAAQRWTIYAAVVLTTLGLWTGASDSFGLPKATALWLAALVLVALSVIRVTEEGALAVPRSPLVVALGALAGALVLTTLTSPTPMLSLIGEYSRYTGLLSYGAFVIVAFHALRLFDVDELATTLRLLTGLAALVAGYTVLQAAGADPVDWESEGFTEIVGTLGNSNLLAGWLAIAVPACLWVAASATGTAAWRWAAGAVAVLATVGAVLSRSFQGPVAVVVGGFVLAGVWLTTDDGRRARAWATRRRGLLVGAAVLLALAAAPFATRAVADGVDDGMAQRQAFWRAAVQMWADDPLLGTGLDTYGQRYLAARPASSAVEQGSTQAESAHSVPLNLLAGGGLVLLLAWLAIVAVTGIALARGLRRLEGEERLLLGALGACWAAYLTQAAVSFDVPELSILHAVVAGGIVAIATPPRYATVVLGWARRPARQRGTTTPTTAAYVVQASAAVALVVGAWWALRPLRADLAVGAAADDVEAGMFEDAAGDLQEATDLAPWQGRYWVLRAQVAERRGEVFEAIGHAEEAARREPGSAQYALLAANLIARYRTPEEARSWADAALARDPANPALIASVARVVAPADSDRARRLADDALDRNPREALAWLAIGEAEIADGDEEAAIEALRTALDLNEALQDAQRALAELTGGGEQP